MAYLSTVQLYTENVYEINNICVSFWHIFALKVIFPLTNGFCVLLPTFSLYFCLFICLSVGLCFYLFLWFSYLSITSLLYGQFVLGKRWRRSQINNKAKNKEQYDLLGGLSSNILHLADLANTDFFSFVFSLYAACVLLLDQYILFVATVVSFSTTIFGVKKNIYVFWFSSSDVFWMRNIIIVMIFEYYISRIF